MTIDIKDIITLSNNVKYIVASKVLYEGNTYYYLIDQENISNIKIYYTSPDNDKMFFESKDKIINTKLLPLFIKEAKKAIPDLFKEFKELDDIEVE